MPKVRGTVAPKSTFTSLSDPMLTVPMSNEWKLSRGAPWVAYPTHFASSKSGEVQQIELSLL